MEQSLPTAFSPAPLNISRRTRPPRAGMWTNFHRPSQKTSVARAMRRPGTPKAQCGPCHSSSQGVSRVEAKAPRLMDQ